MQTKLLWAEITRGTEVLLIPSVAWEEAMLPRIGDYESRWDQRTGTWAVSADAALLIATGIQQLPASNLTKGMAKRQAGDYGSDGVAVEALDFEAGTALQQRAIAFLRAGAFHWRFVEI